MNTPDILVGCKTIANRMGISVRTLYRYIDVMPVARFGKTILILEDDLIQWLKEQAQVQIKAKAPTLMHPSNPPPVTTPIKKPFKSCSSETA